MTDHTEIIGTNIITYDHKFISFVIFTPHPPRRENLVICVSGAGARSGFSALMTDTIPDLGLIECCQCFPRYLYDSKKDCENDLFGTPDGRRDGLTDAGLQVFHDAYGDDTITKDDVFHYIYGLLHSPAYRAQFANDLLRELPRIPPVATLDDFKAFAAAGRALAELHVNYDAVEPYAGVTIKGECDGVDYYVKKMKYGTEKGKDKDKTTIHYNHAITISGIPLRAHDYIVNGKSAIDWVVGRQGVRTDKDSGITNDANLWATETVGSPRYPLDLLLRVITVSLKTLDLVDELPEMAMMPSEYMPRKSNDGVVQSKYKKVAQNKRKRCRAAKEIDENWYENHKLFLKTGGKDGVCADFSGYNLSNKDFSDMDLRGAKFTGCNLDNCDFINSRLDDCEFGNSLLARTDFSGASLDGADFRNAQKFAAKWHGQPPVPPALHEESYGGIF